VVDDELKPDGGWAVTKAKGLLERDKVDFVVGPIFSNILQAIHKPVTDFKDFPDQPECRPVELRRQELQPVFLRDLLPERTRSMRSSARSPQDRGYKRVYLLVPKLSSRQGFRCRIQTRLQGKKLSRRPTCRLARWISRLNSPRSPR